MIPRPQSFLNIGIIILLVLSFGFYGIYKSWGFLKGPEIIIESPSDFQKADNSYLEIKGRAKYVSNLELNGNQIFTDENGDFKEDLLLAKGYNIIVIEAQDKFGRMAKEKREIVLK